MIINHLKWNDYKKLSVHDKLYNKSMAMTPVQSYVDTWITNSIPNTWVTSSATTAYYPSMQGLGTGQAVNTSVDPYNDYNDSIQFNDYSDSIHLRGEHIYTTRNGMKIHIHRDGSYSIIAPEDVDLEELIRLQPNARLLDQYGRVIQVEANGVLGIEALKNATTRFIDIKDPTKTLKDSLAFTHFNKIAIPNQGCRLVLPNDTELIIDAGGLISIKDAEQKVVYEAAPRGFNKYLNASDVLEDFIRYLGTQKVRQRHVMKMPLGLFINWLVIEAAHADGDPADDLQPKLVDGVATVKAQPRCLYCRRFIAQARHDRGINFCRSEHMDSYMAREDLVALPKPSRVRPRLALPPSATYFERAA